MDTKNADLAALRDALGERLVTEATIVNGYENDSSRAVFTGATLGLVLAETADDVSLALAWAHERGIPVSIRGAGTGLVGGAKAYDGGLIVSLERMNQIVSVSPDDRLAVVQPGVITAELDAAAHEHGLFFPPDPASARTSTVGGNIATNAGGLRCVAHGVTSDWVSALTVVLADGRILRTGALTRKNVVGYDLTRLFVGSEGTLGVIVEAAVRLESLPEGDPVTFWAEFDGLAEAGAAVTEIVNSPARPEVLELLDALTVQIIEDVFPSGMRIPAGALLVGQTVGSDAAKHAETILDISRRLGASAAQIAADDSLVEARRMSNPALSARGLKVSCDVGVPVSALAEVFTGIAAIAERHGIEVASVAHAGDGNLHCKVAAPDTPAGLAQADALIDDITRLALSLNGTITGEHGIGLVKHHELPWQLDEVALDVQRAIKRTLDPRDILTPGRAV
ncbi:FAD-binding oxidoreductase [Leucobacter sp. G161]|uniref:FAD-binding oxidoreductase n=1 Tax=Leucobacter sp. G161 TaxID=663704 RepID=UPI00073B5A78|nr:FAD-linked oxidase C-terminal domain-containing protein [Leucobacter sp. G161]KUF06720.1 FAD-linked oxidase [Leucobacter sp. G161]